MRFKSLLMRIVILCLAHIFFQKISAQTITVETGDEPVVVEQKVVAMAIVRDRPIIEMILEENTLPGIDPDSVEYLQILDATNNGFGDEDIVVVFPWQKAYTFFATKRLKDNMETWEVSAENQVVTENRAPEFFEQQPAADSTELAKNWMLASILRGVNNNYSDIPMKIYFERKRDGTIQFNTWGYNRQEEALKPQPDAYLPGRNIKNYDVYRVLRRDSVTRFISNTTLYDQIYIYHQTSDTVFFAPDTAKKLASKLLSTDLQPGLIPPPVQPGVKPILDSLSVTVKDTVVADSTKNENDSTAIDPEQMQKLLEENLSGEKKDAPPDSLKIE